MKIHIPPTGNADRDTANLQAALSDLSMPQAGASWEYGTLGLDGVYSINQPLICGGPLKKAPTIDGGNATIIWRGPKTDEPMISFGAADDPGSGGMSMACVVRDLLLVGNKNARGLRFARQTHRSLMENVYVYASRQIAIDLNDCWGSSARNVTVRHGNGQALRTTEFNGTSFNNLYVQGMVDDDWPEDGQRAFIQHSGSACVFGSFLMQACSLQDGALIHSGVRTQFLSPYFEGCDCRSYFHIVGGWDYPSGRGFVIDGASATTLGATQVPYFVTLSERTHDVVVRDSKFRGISKHLVHADNGKHYAPLVERCGSYYEQITDDKWTGAAEGALVFAESPEEMRKEEPNTLEPQPSANQ